MTNPAISAPTAWWVRVASLGLVLLNASMARADEPTLAEAKYKPSEQPPESARPRIVLTGIALTAVWYGAGVGTSYLWSKAPNAHDLRLPIVGPWMALGDIGCGPRESHCPKGIIVLRTALAVLSGIGQVGGLAVATEGVFMSSADTAAGASSSNATPAPGDGPEAGSSSSGPRASRAERNWAAVPVVLPTGAALSFVGRF
jgi:hypothetical protein